MATQFAYRSAYKKKGFKTENGDQGAVVNNPTKALAQRFIEILNGKELYKLGEVLSEQVVWHGTGGIGSHQGVEHYRRILGQVFGAFSR